MVNIINRERASKDELNTVKSWLETLNNRVKHLSIFSGEIVDYLGPRVQDDEGKKLVKLQAEFKVVNKMIQKRDLAGDEARL